MSIFRKYGGANKNSKIFMIYFKLVHIATLKFTDRGDVGFVLSSSLTNNVKNSIEKHTLLLSHVCKL